MRALDSHESTKHSWERIRANPHSLDFANMPLPFKIYSGVARRPLSTDLPDSAVPALAALAKPGAHAGGDRVPARNELARLLSAVGITKRRRYPGGEMLFRGAPCTGAHAAAADAPVVLVLTSTWWRNAWKCQARDGLPGLVSSEPTERRDQLVAPILAARWRNPHLCLHRTTERSRRDGTNAYATVPEDARGGL